MPDGWLSLTHRFSGVCGGEVIRVTVSTVSMERQKPLEQLHKVVAVGPTPLKQGVNVRRAWRGKDAVRNAAGDTVCRYIL